MLCFGRRLLRVCDLFQFWRNLLLIFQWNNIDYSTLHKWQKDHALAEHNKYVMKKKIS